MNSEKRNARGRGRGRGRGARGRARGRGRGKKVPKVMSSDEEDCSVEETSQEAEDTAPEEIKAESEQADPPKLEVPSDISQLEAPVFTTLQRGPPEPMLRLDWSHRATLIGEKVLNPMIYCCDICSKPILIYGRMIPCKHVFCLSCARSDHTHCPRCREKVLRVEQTGLGTVFMCTHSGTRYSNTGCRRTYLSQRDLQAHINHRHVPSGADNKAEADTQPNVALVKPLTTGGAAGDRGGRPRTNLITVPLHDPPEQHDAHAYYNYYQAGAPTGAAGAPTAPAASVIHNMSVPPPYYAPAPPPYAPPAPAPAPAAYAPPPGGTIATNVVSPMPAVSMGPGGAMGDPGRWPEGSYQAMQWPQNQHHYYR